MPNDPRGEPRWCLSEITSLADEPRRTRADAVRLDLTDGFVDVIEIARTTAEGIETLDAKRLRMLASLLNGDFLEGLEIECSPVLNGGVRTSGEMAAACAVRPAVHEMLLNALARCSRIREGEEHLKATARLFEAEGLDSVPIPQCLALSPER